MIRFFLALLLATSAFAEKPSSADYHVSPLPVPADPGAQFAPLSRSGDGTVWLAWNQPGKTNSPLYFSTLSAANPTWSSARSIVTLPKRLAGRLALAASGQTVVLVWTDGLKWSTVLSTSRGASWRNLNKLSGIPGHSPAITALAGGGFAIAWLENIPSSQGPGHAKVKAVTLAADGRPGSIETVGFNACDCCPISLAPFADGGALLAYRGLTGDQDRDPMSARLHDGKWGESDVLSNDGWLSFGCPENGPRLATDGGRVAAIWFTGADHDPRLLVTGSPNAGEQFLLPLRVDGGISEGIPDTSILHDGTALAFWAEDTSTHTERSLRLRRITPDYALQPAVKVADLTDKTTVAAVSSALVSDYAGGAADAILVLLATSTDNSKATSYLVTVKESELLALADPNCHCAPSPAELVGYDFKGAVVATGSDRLTASHGEIEGILDEGQTEFRVDPALLKGLDPATGILGRIERRAGVWWLYDVRIMGAGQAAQARP